MDEKQLNFNQPLLSVRRGLSPAVPPEVNKKKSNESYSLPPLPYYKSDLKSGPVRNPGVIPFQWEQSPGRPKKKNQAQVEDILKQQPPLPPKLPSRRVVNQKQQKPTGKELKDSPASSSRSHSETALSAPELSSWEKAMSVLQEPEDGRKSEDVSSSEDENVVFEDPRDKLSRTNSFFVNCSVSGVVGLDDPNADPSGAFIDPQARDFMMGRFLHASKAVASEAPQFASRKRPVAREHPKPAKEVAMWSSWAPQDRSTDALAHNEMDKGKEEEVGEEDETRTCGLSPQIIPGIRSDRGQVNSSVRGVSTRPNYDGRDRFTGTLRSKKGSPQSFLGIERGFLGLPEEPRDFRVGKVDLHTKGVEKMSSRSNPAAEKTVHIDSERTVESWSSSSSSSESRGRNPSVDYSLQDIKSLCGDDEKPISQPKIPEKVDSSIFSTSKKLSQDVREDNNDTTTTNANTNTHFDNVTPYGFGSNVVWIEDMIKKHPVKPNPKVVTQESKAPLGLAPLLPQSPSESWLSRTLPFVSLKNLSSKSSAGHMILRPSPVDPKRERMLKSSIVKQHMLLWPPGGLAPILED